MSAAGYSGAGAGTGASKAKQNNFKILQAFQE